VYDNIISEGIKFIHIKELSNMHEAMEILSIPIELITVNPNQPRKQFTSGTLLDLADSIKKYGVMQPVNVRRRTDNPDLYELIAGERRLRASLLAGKGEIPAVVMEADDADSALLALIENVQRENLNYMEEAQSYSSIIAEYGMTQEALAKSLGKSQSSVANKTRLLKLPEDVRSAAVEGGLTERHARALLNLPCDDMKRNALKKIAAGGLNVKDTEKLIENMLKEEKTARKGRRIKWYARDLRLFTNTITQAVNMMNDGGVKTVCEIEEKEYGCFINILVTY